MKLKNAEGFTVVELIVAIIVGVIFISSLNLAVNNYTNLGARGRHLVLANSYAEAKVEGLRNSGYNAIGLGTSSLTSELPAQLPGRNGSMTISQPQSGIKQIDLTISYNDLGNNRTYTYRTYIGELGVGQ